MRLKFWKFILEFTHRKIYECETMEIKRLKIKYSGKNPAMKCDCDDCWLYALDMGALKNK